MKIGLFLTIILLFCLFFFYDNVKNYIEKKKTEYAWLIQHWSRLILAFLAFYIWVTKDFGHVISFLTIRFWGKSFFQLSLEWVFRVTLKGAPLALSYILFRALCSGTFWIPDTIISRMMPVGNANPIQTTSQSTSDSGNRSPHGSQSETSGRGLISDSSIDSTDWPEYNFEGEFLDIVYDDCNMYGMDTLNNNLFKANKKLPKRDIANVITLIDEDEDPPNKEAVGNLAFLHGQKMAQEAVRLHKRPDADTLELIKKLRRS